jgi:hypothetical protein
MFRPAAVAVVLSVVVFISILVSAVGAWMPPPPSQYAAHSYSGRTIGYRALYETLELLGYSVERSWETPEDLFRGRRRIVLLQPNLYFLEREKGYLDSLSKWVKEGGEVVLVTRELNFLEDNPRFAGEEEDRDRAEKVFGEDKLAASLGIEGLHVEPVFYSDEPLPSPPVLGRAPKVVLAIQPELDYLATFEGSFEALEEDVDFLRLPEEKLRWFEGGPVEEARGAVWIDTVASEQVPIALEFALGKGSVVLVSEPVIFNNIGLGAADNAVLAQRLVAGDGTRTIVFDEYYHGALAGMGAFALLGVFPYGAIAAFVLLATLLWAWANGVRFGPPLHAPVESRRNILEYVDAMARLFRRGGKRPFVLKVNREGLLDELRRELHLPAGTPSEAVRRRLAQSDPARGQRLDGVLNEVDRVLVSGQPVSETELLHLQERLETCRTSKAPNPAPKPSAPSTAS